MSKSPANLKSKHGTVEPTGGGVALRPVIELLNVSKLFPGQKTPAVSSLTLQVEEGEFFSLLGPSGSGKTTTLRLIGGFEHPSEGVVRLDGVDVSDRPPYKRDVNTVFQNYALFPHMRVRENVAYPLRMRKVPRPELSRQVSEMVERVELRGFEERYPHQLSGGQRQRVALARALIGRPRVLLLDEPLGALDLKLRETMMLVLKRLQRDTGITFVYVTHDQGEALAMSDRLAVMSMGVVEQVASPAEVYSRPLTPFVARFIGKSNLLHCTRQERGLASSGTLRLTISDSIEAESFIASVRPEAIVIGDGSQGLANKFVGTVAEALFLGHEREVVIETEDHAFTARIPASESVALGSRLIFGWDREALIVVGGDHVQRGGDQAT